MSPSPQLSADDAVRIAQRQFGVENPEAIHEPKLKILPIIEQSDYSWSLTWEIRIFSLQPVKDITYYVDARTGSVLEEVNNIRHDTIHGTITGTYWPESANVNPTTEGFFSRIRVFNTAGQTVANMLSNYNGNYSTGNLSFGWYTVEAQLANSWIQIRDNASSGDRIVHEMSGNPGQYNHQWSASDGTNVHWHATAMHDFFKGSPFNYSGMDYQMRGYINNGSGTNGAANGTDIFFGSQGGQPWARSRDVVTHEYTHNVIFQIYSGWIGNPGTQGGAMDEGISDYFAATTKITPNPIIGADVGVNRTLNNNFAWNAVNGDHWNGQVIGGALWRTRQAIGNATVANNLAFKALQITPRARNFEDYLYNVYVVNNSQYSGAYFSEITNSFDHHGINTQPPPLPAPTLTGNVSGGAPNLSWNTITGADSYKINRMSGHPNVSNTTFTTSNTSYTDNSLPFPVEIAFELDDFVIYNVQAVNNQWGDGFQSNWIIYKETGSFAKVTQQEADGSKEKSGNRLPDSFNLTKNYPNPFNPTTTLSYTLPILSQVTIDVFNIMGQRVARLVNTTQAAGEHEVIFDAGNLSSGVYIARMTVSGSDGRFFSNEVTMNLVK